MIQRVRSSLVLSALLDGNAPAGLIDKDFSANDWLADQQNIALRIADDLAMFEHYEPGVYMGHVWFASRGKQAIVNGKAMLAAMFKEYGAETIRGETPVTQPHAMQFCRRLGFTYSGEADRSAGRIALALCGKPPAVVPVLDKVIPAR